MMGRAGARVDGAPHRNLLLKLLLIGSTTVLPLAVGKLCMPLKWHAFRCWEVLNDYRPARAADGSLYANQVLQKTVRRGDRGPFGCRR